MTIAARLNEALERGRFTKLDFQKEIATRLEGGQSGATYQTVLAYCNGTFEPSIEWIREAAKILDVKPSWIAFGDPIFSAPRSTRETVMDRLAEFASSQQDHDFGNLPFGPDLGEAADRIIDQCIFDMRARVRKLEEFAADLIAEREREDAVSASGDSH